MRRLDAVWIAFSFLFGSICVGGCRAPREQRIAGYFGPTEPLAQVVAKINSNNSLIPTVWAKGYFEATIVDDKNRRQFVNGDAIILHRKPSEFRMVGRKDVAGQIFELGATAERYWMIVRPEADTMWWGEFAHLAHADPRLIPIRPDLLMQVLAVGQIDPDLLKTPAPVMRFNNDADAYMLVWVDRGADRYIAQREVWYDRQTMQPRLVLLFDSDGRIVLRAYLSRHQPVDIGPVAANPPTMATQFDLLFPGTGSKLSLTLNEVKLTSNGVPKEGTIRFPGENAGVSNVIRVDEPAAR